MYDVNVQGVCKKFGNVYVVKHINFFVKKGEILGFLGQNGAGKTTTIKMLTGQLLPTEGHIEIFGMNITDHHKDIMSKIGYIPDTPILYEGLTPKEMLGFIGRLYNMKTSVLSNRIHELLSVMNLKDFEDELIKNFSLGMKKKVSIACGLIHSPKLLILDEVTNGLDPRSAREIKDLIKVLNEQQGVSCLLTTHILDVVEELAHRIIIIEKGEIIEQGELVELKEKYKEKNLEGVFLKAIS
ncbi:ABC transporter ATP-binding protein [Anoxybacillus sp. TBDG-1]